MSNVSRDLREIYADFKIYEQKLEEDLKKRRALLITELTEQNRELAFIPLLEESRQHSLPEETFEQWQAFWESFPPNEQQYLEESFRRARMGEGEWADQNS